MTWRGIFGASCLPAQVRFAPGADLNPVVTRHGSAGAVAGELQVDEKTRVNANVTGLGRPKRDPQPLFIDAAARPPYKRAQIPEAPGERSAFAGPCWAGGARSTGGETK
jgi:hypothetical protein